MVKYSSNVVTELTLGRNHTNALFVILVLQKTTDLKTHQHNHTREKHFQGNTCKTHCIGGLSAYSKNDSTSLFKSHTSVLSVLCVSDALVKRYFGNLLQNSHRG